MTLHVNVCERRERPSRAARKSADVTAMVALRMGKGALLGQVTAISIGNIALALWFASEHG